MDIIKSIMRSFDSMGFQCDYKDNIIKCRPYDYFEDPFLSCIINRVETKSFNKNMYILMITDANGKSVSNIINYTDDRSLKNNIIAMIRVLEDY